MENRVVNIDMQRHNEQVLVDESHLCLYYVEWRACQKCFWGLLDEGLKFYG